MASPKPRQQPSPPIRTVNSTASTPQQTSPTTFSPISPGSTTPGESYFPSPRRHTESAISNSPTERSFFGVITQKVRERSRSRTRVHRSRSRSPAPPSQVASPPASTSPTRPQKSRHSSDVTQYAAQTSTVTTPPPPPQHQRQNSDHFYYGRHANQWLFGGFSVREKANSAFDALQKRRTS